MQYDIPYELFAVILAMAVFVLVKFLRIRPKYSRDVSKIFIVSGAVAAGVFSGVTRTNQDIALFAAAAVMLVFVVIGVLAVMLRERQGRNPTPHKPSQKIGPAHKSGPSRTIGEERHDYTNLGK